jgi:Zn-finger nucleic acid-binding protein
VGPAQQSPKSPYDPVESQKSLPLATCPVCGSTWFREVEVNRYLPQEPTHWVELRQQEALNRTHPRLRVCLCGAPLRPVVGGGLIYQAIEEVVSFKQSLDGALKEIKSSRRDFEEALKGWVENPLTKDRLDAAAARLRRAEEMVLWEQKKADPKEVFGARKPWKEIDREPEAQGALGRDDLVLALQEKGFTYRMARLLVKVILETLHLKLGLEHEMETPFGVLRLAAAPKQREHRAFGRLVKTYTHKMWIRFRPASDLTIRVPDEADAEEEEEDLEMEQEDEPVACPRCKSTWLMEGEFRQYMEAYGSTPGADIFPLDDGPAFRSRVCLCGQPVGPMLKQAYSDVPGVKDFLENVQKAQQYLKQQAEAVNKGVERLLLKLARRDVQEQLLARLSNVESGLKKLGWDVTDGF